jgi:hypothetical protein
MSGMSQQDVLDLVVHRAVELADADAGLVLLTPTGTASTAVSSLRSETSTPVLPGS